MASPIRIDLCQLLQLKDLKEEPPASRCSLVLMGSIGKAFGFAAKQVWDGVFGTGESKEIEIDQPPLLVNHISASQSTSGTSSNDGSPSTREGDWVVVPAQALSSQCSSGSQDVQELSQPVAPAGSTDEVSVVSGALGLDILRAALEKFAAKWPAEAAELQLLLMQEQYPHGIPDGPFYISVACHPELVLAPSYQGASIEIQQKGGPNQMWELETQFVWLQIRLGGWVQREGPSSNLKRPSMKFPLSWTRATSSQSTTLCFALMCGENPYRTPPK